VLGEDHVLVIDTRTSHRQAEEIRADLRQLPGVGERSISIVVNTHAHSDHCFGNRILRPASIWGHQLAAANLRRTGERQREALIREMPAMAAEFREIEIDPPDQTFSERAELDLGGRTVELRYLGRGHTDGDIVVRVPDAAVLFAGDLLENGADPYYGDAFPLDWPATAAVLVELADGPVVPGHGDVADRAFAERQAGEIGEIVELARAVEAGDVSLDAAAGRHPWAFEPARAAIERALAQLRGEVR
jgi:glyoxylase-like metal-dependent hydrolase (beta-lactamase superfamily II)